jgi:hypothetical protein
MTQLRRPYRDVLRSGSKRPDKDMKAFLKALGDADTVGVTIAISPEGRAALERARTGYADVADSIAGAPYAGNALQALYLLDQAIAQTMQVLDEQAAFPAELAARSARNARKAAADLAKAMK